MQQQEVECVAKTVWAMGLEAAALWQEVQASHIRKEVHSMTLQLACLEEVWAHQMEAAEHQEEEMMRWEAAAETRTWEPHFRWESCPCRAVEV
jgi:hypothetical protein